MAIQAPTVIGALAGYDDPDARARLRRMKAYAGGLLAFAAAVFLATFAMPDNSTTGYVRAAAEAGMVGGLADWFAVTALFRHPLRLKIPHTALVPRKKDELATKLGEFVSGNFITPDAVVEQVVKADLVRKAAEKLKDPAAADAVGRELSRLLSAAVGTLDDQLVAQMVLEHVRRDLDRRSYAREFGQLLTTAVQNQAQQPLIELVLPVVRQHIERNRDDVHAEIKRFADGLGWKAWLFATNRQIDKLIDQVITTLAEMERIGSAHPIRRQIDELLAKLAGRLVHDAPAADTVDVMLRGLAANPAIEGWLQEVLAHYLDTVRDALADPTASLERQLGAMVQRLGERTVTDPEFAAGINRGLEQAVRYAVAQYGDQVVALISTQVAKWDATDASHRIETAVGRDLQFIRINGTVVGALAGVAIHTVAVVVG